VDDGSARGEPSEAAAWARRLTPLAWLFVILAGLDLLQRLLSLPGPMELTTGVAAVARAVSHALIVLLPAAVLVGEPTAWRARRLVLVGALTLAGAELGAVLLQAYGASLLAPDTAGAERLPGESLGDLIRFALVLAWLVGPVLLGFGLARRLRGAGSGPSMRPTPARLFVLALGIIISGLEILQVLGLRGPLHRLDVVTGVVGALLAVAWAYVAAVALPDVATPVSARRGRMALAAGALAFVAASALSIVNTAVLDGLVDLPSGFFALSSVLSGVGAVLLIAGFAAGLPDPETAGPDTAPAEAA
jgi:hypothetical protein